MSGNYDELFRDAVTQVRNIFFLNFSPPPRRPTKKWFTSSLILPLNSGMLVCKTIDTLKVSFFSDPCSLHSFVAI
jgi:hypothetical protein